MACLAPIVEADVAIPRQERRPIIGAAADPTVAVGARPQRRALSILRAATLARIDL